MFRGGDIATPEVIGLMAAARPTEETLRLLADVPSEVELRFLPEGEDLADHVEGVEVIYGHVDEEALSRADQLRWVQSHSTGVDSMMYPAFRRSDVILTSLGGALTTVVAEHAVALLLALIRNLHLQRDLQSEKRWQLIVPGELQGATVGILGFGRIGRAVASRLSAFGADIMALDPVPKDRPDHVPRIDGVDWLPEFLAQSGAVVVTCPSTPQTRRMLSHDQFALMPDGSYLVNVSRGDVVDEKALVAAIRSGTLAGAGIDVTDPEPCPQDSPLWTEPNVILTPHSAGWSHRLGERKIGWFARNLRRCVEGRPLLGVVDKERGW